MYGTSTNIPPSAYYPRGGWPPRHTASAPKTFVRASARARAPSSPINGGGLPRLEPHPNEAQLGLRVGHKQAFGQQVRWVQVPVNFPIANRPDLAACCNHMYWRSTWRNFPAPSRLQIPMHAELWGVHNNASSQPQISAEDSK